MTPFPPVSRTLICLIGARGCGKSSVGRLLAQHLGWEFRDADTVLEDTHGRSIKSIFAAEGEESFRDKETAILADLCCLQNHVIATGGGVILRPDNRGLLRQSAWVVWLTADIQTLSGRLSQDATTAGRRPALTAAAKDASSPEEIAAVLRFREPLYRACADAIIATAGRHPDDIVGEIIEVWHDYRRRGGPIPSASDPSATAR